MKYRPLVREENQDPDIYMALAQLPSRTASLLVRGSETAEELVPALRGILQEMDPEVPLYEATTLPQLVDRQTGPARFQTLLIAGFSGVALVLALVGIYGVIAYAVHLRTQEIGIRLALGARPRQVLGMLVAQGMRLAVVGLLLGLGASVALTRVLSGQLYEVAPTDPGTFAGVALLLGAVALAASVLPARRAMRIDPMAALRHE